MSFPLHLCHSRESGNLSLLSVILMVPHQIGDDKYNVFLKSRQIKIEKREGKNRISHKIKRYSKKIVIFI